MKILGWYSFIMVMFMLGYLLLDLLGGVDAEDSMVAMLMFSPVAYYLFNRAKME